MKQLFILSALFLSLSTFSQNKYFGDIQIGSSLTTDASNLYIGTFGFNTVLTNNLYLRAGLDYTFGGSYEKSNSLINYSQYSLRIGINNSISEKFEIRSYTGIAYQSGTATTSRYDEVANALGEISSFGFEAIGISTEEKADKFLGEKFNSIAIPFGVDFHMHGRKIGFVTGIYANIAKYSDFGLRIGITFGKL